MTLYVLFGACCLYGLVARQGVACRRSGDLEVRANFKRRLSKSSKVMLSSTKRDPGCQPEVCKTIWKSYSRRGPATAAVNRFMLCFENSYFLRHLPSGSAIFEGPFWNNFATTSHVAILTHTRRCARATNSTTSGSVAHRRTILCADPQNIVFAILF